jgi:hypothetical protein
VSPATRTSLIVSTCDAEPGFWIGTPPVVVVAYGVNALPYSRGTITTSPLAASPLGDKLKTMLPLLPVAGLLYSPTHFPASDARAAESPVTVIGVGFDAQATTKAADAARNSLLDFTTPSSVEKRSTEGWVG